MHNFPSYMCIFLVSILFYLCCITAVNRCIVNPATEQTMLFIIFSIIFSLQILSKSTAVLYTTQEELKEYLIECPLARHYNSSLYYDIVDKDHRALEIYRPNVDGNCLSGCQEPVQNSHARILIATNGTKIPPFGLEAYCITNGGDIITKYVIFKGGKLRLEMLKSLYV